MFVDRRQTGWPELDRDGYVDRLREMYEHLEDFVASTPVMYRIAPGGVLAHAMAQGRRGGGTEVQWEAIVISMGGAGQVRRMEYFEPTEREAAEQWFQDLLAD